MLIRLEIAEEHNIGIYQSLLIEVTNEICYPAGKLPVPNLGKGCDRAKKYSFWFTLKGWQEYGKGFVNLFYESPEDTGIDTFLTPVSVSIIEDETKVIFTRCDEYQVAISRREIDKLHFKPFLFMISMNGKDLNLIIRS